MDHQEASTGKFTERYLLGELNPAQRDEFEEHFFDCSICGEDVETGAVFIESARSVLRAQETVTPPVAWYPKFGLPFQSASFAAVFLVAVVAYQNVVTIPTLQANSGGRRSAEVVSSVSLVGLDSRAESRPIVLLANKDALLELEVPGGPDFRSYSFRILDSNNQVRVELPVTAEQAKNVVKLSLPGSSLTAGNYQIQVFGKEADNREKELSRYSAFVQ